MMNKNDYFNRVYGGWLGKCLGGAAGAPVEGIKKLLPYKDYKEMIRLDLPNDNLDLQLLWFEVMEEKDCLSLQKIWQMLGKNIAGIPLMNTGFS